MEGQYFASILRFEKGVKKFYKKFKIEQVIEEEDLKSLAKKIWKENLTIKMCKKFLHDEDELKKITQEIENEYRKQLKKEFTDKEKVILNYHYDGESTR